ncbi:MAG TPA: tetratricopeptide repeat protein, partial [Candidatus Cloacimonadota bacterium]|nr:tetratricopeptide repeat protein [Candidatus Cloacimonadota bacterium]
MKKFLLILTCSVFVLLFATEKEDVFFIKALMQDKYYRLALDETKDFMKKYPYSEFKNEISLIQADIMIQEKDFLEAETILNSINNSRLTPVLEQYWLLLQTENSQNIGQEDLMFVYANTYLKKYGKLEGANKMYLLIGDHFMKESNYIKAKEYYNKINKDNTEVNYRLLNLCLESGERSSADSLYADILAHSKNIDNVDFATIILVDYQEKHKEWSNLMQTIDSYFVTYHNSQFSGLNEVQQNLFFHQLNALIQLNEYDLAIEYISKYDSPDDRKTYYQGLALIKKGELIEGIQTLEQLVSTTNDSEIKSNSFFQIINSKSSGDINSTIDELNNFLINNPDQKWTGDIYYQIAFSLYKQKNYNDAISYLDKALSFGTGNIGSDILKREFEEKVYFIKTECLFYLSKKKECINIASDFYKAYPNSVFIDELMFKLSICLYQTSQVDSSYYYFKKIVTDYPNSAKAGMSNYYLGEIELSKKHYNLAKEHFRVSLSGKIDLGAAYLKLSYIEYALKDYSKAKTYLSSVPEDEDYLFDKYLLMGNIVFSERKYSDALKHYKKAESKVPDQLSLELIWARQAWTLNLLKRYDEAKNIYKQLSEQFNEPGKYKLAAANAAYNAENYLQAIELFTEYLQEYPDSEENYKVISGIANSQFNLSNYEDAISKWDSLVDEKYSQEIIENAILGIQWS